ncbi:uncharacterized protein LOC141646653 [Silene latifolia]|uniref:uncharacterized protein LOC141646653 n=1 Tax=Silene latifolia TaxID=37657 RepID=UPI003D7860D0
MGIQLGSIQTNEPHYKTKKLFLLSNYMLLGASSSCIFLTLSLRLIPSLCGFFFISLHLLTILGALAGCHAAAGQGQGSSKWFITHMIATVLTAIFQGSISVLIFTRTDDFLASLKSYVMEGNGVVILKLAGGLCGAIFVLEWIVLTVAFFLKYYAVVECGGGGGGGNNGGNAKRSNKVGSSEEELGYLPYPSSSFNV